MSIDYYISFDSDEERGSSRGVDENARFDKNENEGMDFELDPIFVTACACARGIVEIRPATASTTGLSSLLDRCIPLVVVWYQVMGIR